MLRRPNGEFARQPIAHGTYPGLRQHQRQGVPDTPECGSRAAYNAYKRGRGYAHRRGTCVSCGREDVQVVAHDGKDYCRHACYQRWKLAGFEGDGPAEPYAERRRAIDTAREWRDVLMRMPAKHAAIRIGVTHRTALRYKKLLEAESAERVPAVNGARPVQGDGSQVGAGQVPDHHAAVAPGRR